MVYYYPYIRIPSHHFFYYLISLFPTYRAPIWVQSLDGWVWFIFNFQNKKRCRLGILIGVVIVYLAVSVFWSDLSFPPIPGTMSGYKSRQLGLVFLQVSKQKTLPARYTNRGGNSIPSRQRFLIWPLFSPYLAQCQVWAAILNFCWPGLGAPKVPNWWPNPILCYTE